MSRAERIRLIFGDYIRGKITLPAADLLIESVIAEAVAEEREACAKLVFDQLVMLTAITGDEGRYDALRNDLTTAIRNRGKS